MRASKIVEGLKILANYTIPGGLEKLSVEAQHDIIYCGPDIQQKSVTQEDTKRLEELGWHYDEESESWAAFT